MLSFRQIFRNDDGTPSDDPNSGLRLSLGDFAAEALTDQFNDLNDDILISSQDLCKYLDDAERRASTVRQKKGVVNPKPAQLTKRRRQSTPPDDLDEAREQRFRDEEERARKRRAQDDSSYHTGSTSEPDSC